MKLKIKKEKIFFTITWLRLILAFIVAISLISNRRNIALFIFILTALVGFFENFITRKYPSGLRSIIDFFADKLLVNLTAIILTIKGIIPIWVTLIILARDLLTIIGGTLLFIKNIRREFKPTVLGKIGYFFQLMALIPPLLNSKVDWYVMSAALVLTVSSGIYALLKSEFRVIRRKTDLDEFKFYKLLKFADLFTLLNVATGLVSIVLSITNHFNLAATMLLIAVIFDYLDGKIAKSMHQQNSFGKELDSLADTVSFGIAPAIFGFSFMQFATNLEQFQLTFGIIAFTIFLFCGILRLARYNIMDLKGVYQGMPITLNGIIIPVVYFLGTPIKFYPYIYLLLGILMISSLRIKKLF
ncbi:CDP-diacylglycerol--serine O-phosphatidyltransferase [Candidatus Woesearchaeota archaeon]|jgi:CDP-diacylglycerol--serine O-phosphatidyltransferase|nr:CDP-diacylglycerol--serine O-phosphatidyltransferase [Candidatus Woesearchaeota archaeon]MDP6648005.1 CDP-diacylglycerol--serine O-phosphatidyltransferase [Candidatus Woesearchaeota archaeon]|tara:strand:+ start:45251 stop:46321 length:1071 start_codon:yes stop_codon:yes gene_type:complete